MSYLSEGDGVLTSSAAGLILVIPPQRRGALQSLQPLGKARPQGRRVREEGGEVRPASPSPCYWCADFNMTSDTSRPRRSAWWRLFLCAAPPSTLEDANDGPHIPARLDPSPSTRLRSGGPTILYPGQIPPPSTAFASGVAPPSPQGRGWERGSPSRRGGGAGPPPLTRRATSPPPPLPPPAPSAAALNAHAMADEVERAGAALVRKGDTSLCGARLKPPRQV